jgi:Tol biopolymer transport system component
MRPAISPDGHHAAFWQKDQVPGAVWRIAVVQLPEGTFHKSFDVSQSPTNGNTNLRWTPDGNSIVYMDYHEGTTSFWNQPLNAAATQKINEVANNQIYAFDIAQDGRYIFSRGLHTNDVVVISDAHR